MTQYEIAALYIALSTLLFLVLTFRVIFVRRSDKISLGDNDNPKLRKRIRSHANFTETVPIALLGLMALAALGANTTAMHVFGTALLIGRGLHAHGMMGKNAVGPGRPLGMVITTSVILGQALYLLYLVWV